MTARFVTFNTSYGYGLYLSKPGIDATTNPDPANFLLHCNVKEEQVLTAGYAGIGPSSSAFVGFPTGAAVAAVDMDEFFHGGIWQSVDAV